MKIQCNRAENTLLSRGQKSRKTEKSKINLFLREEFAPLVGRTLSSSSWLYEGA